MGILNMSKVCAHYLPEVTYTAPNAAEEDEVEEQRDGGSSSASSSSSSSSSSSTKDRASRSSSLPAHLDPPDLAMLNKNRRFLKCVVCRTRKGSCVQCSIPQCTKGYHPTCAVSANIPMNRVDLNADEKDERKAAGGSGSSARSRRKRPASSQAPKPPLYTTMSYCDAHREDEKSGATSNGGSGRRAAAGTNSRRKRRASVADVSESTNGRRGEHREGSSSGMARNGTKRRRMARTDNSSESSNSSGKSEESESTGSSNQLSVPTPESTQSHKKRRRSTEAENILSHSRRRLPTDFFGRSADSETGASSTVSRASPSPPPASSKRKKANAKKRRRSAGRSSAKHTPARSRSRAPGTPTPKRQPVALPVPVVVPVRTRKSRGSSSRSAPSSSSAGRAARRPPPVSATAAASSPVPAGEAASSSNDGVSRTPRGDTSPEKPSPQRAPPTRTPKHTAQFFAIRPCRGWEFEVEVRLRPSQGEWALLPLNSPLSAATSLPPYRRTPKVQKLSKVAPRDDSDSKLNASASPTSSSSASYAPPSSSTSSSSTVPSSSSSSSSSMGGSRRSPSAHASSARSAAPAEEKDTSTSSSSSSQPAESDPSLTDVWRLLSTTDTRSPLAHACSEAMGRQWNPKIVDHFPTTDRARRNRKNVGFTALKDPTGLITCACMWSFWEIASGKCALVIKFLSTAENCRRKKHGSLVISHIIDLAFSRKSLYWILVCSELGPAEKFWAAQGFEAFSIYDERMLSQVSTNELNPFNNTVLLKLDRRAILQRRVDSLEQGITVLSTPERRQLYKDKQKENQQKNKQLLRQAARKKKVEDSDAQPSPAKTPKRKRDSARPDGLIIQNTFGCASLEHALLGVEPRSPSALGVPKGYCVDRTCAFERVFRVWSALNKGGKAAADAGKAVPYVTLDVKRRV